MYADDLARLGLAAGALLANAPFVLAPAARPALRWLGWALGWLLWLGLGAWLGAAGSRPPTTDWSLWPVTGALFAVLAFPGLSYRYCWRRSGAELS